MDSMVGEVAVEDLGALGARLRRAARERKPREVERVPRGEEKDFIGEEVGGEGRCFLGEGYALGVARLWWGQRRVREVGRRKKGKGGDKSHGTAYFRVASHSRSNQVADRRTSSQGWAMRENAGGRHLSFRTISTSRHD